MRRSGKTTRMVEEALIQSSYGKHVLIFAINESEAGRIREVMLDILARPEVLTWRHVPNRHLIRVYGYSPETFREKTCGYNGEWFIDHAVEENGGLEPGYRWIHPGLSADHARYQRDRSDAIMRRRAEDALNRLHGGWDRSSGHGDRTGIGFYRTTASVGRPSRESRFDTLRAEGKKLGEINTILEAEGYSESFGEGVMPCPTKSHEIVRENKGAKQMIAKMGAGHT